MQVLVKAWGPYACFTRPEFSTERKSYDIITPSAARGMLTAIYWHPGVVYTVKRIWVRNPIKFANIRRNEVSEVVSASKAYDAARKGEGKLYMSASSCIQQRMSTILQDVCYYILFDISIDPATANPNLTLEKVGDILYKRLQLGAYFFQPYFGTREFAAYFEPARMSDIPPCPSSLKGTRDLGIMLYDLDFSDKEHEINPIFYHPIMRDGCVEVNLNA